MAVGLSTYPAIETTSQDDLAEIRAAARAAGIALELGTRGVTTAHLLKYLDLAAKLDVTFVRTMLNTTAHKPTVTEAIALLTEVLPHSRSAG